MDNANCPNCKAKIVDSVFNYNAMLSKQKVQLINYFKEIKVQDFCNKCGDELYRKAGLKMIDKRTDVITNLGKIISKIPIVTLQSPLYWDYLVCGIVTAQSTTGTGVFSEITSSFTDFFGQQSGTYNKKLKDGEDLCQNILRKKAIEIGANAIVAVDIDYAEVGGGKGMLMVCMAGTAIHVKNVEILGENSANALMEFNEQKAQLEIINKYIEESRESGF